MSFLASLFGIPEAQAEGDSLDARIAANQRADYGPGGRLYNPENWAAVQQHQADQGTGSVEASLWGAGAAGATEILYDPGQWYQDVGTGFDIAGDAAAKVTGDATGAVWRNFKKVFSAVPLWLWLAVGLGVFAYLGGFTMLKGKLKMA